MRILLIADDVFAEQLRALAINEGYEPMLARAHADLLRTAFEFQPQIILLSALQTGPPIPDVCRQLREFFSGPLVVLADSDGEADAVQALDAGADDYLSKRIGTQELLARIRARLRPHAYVPATDPLPYLDKILEVDVVRRRVLKRGEPVLLTPTEFQILVYLVKHATQVIPKEELLRKALGPERRVDEDYLKVYITRLRSKIEDDPRQPKYIVNSRGVGYFFQPKT